MSRRIFRKVALLGVVVAISTTTLTGCVKPYQKPVFQKIEANETAFLIPLRGDTDEQAIFESEELLKKAKVPTKEVKIPTYWVQTGRMKWKGEYKPEFEMVKVDRSPVTREWTNDTTGTSEGNQAVTAKTKDGIKIVVNLNATAQIEEADTPRYLYLYNKNPLSQVMDSEIKAMVHSKLIEEVSRYNLSELQLDKIMEKLRTDVTDYFKGRGIAITALGLAGDPIYPKDIQDAINETFKAEQAKETQKLRNERAESLARSEAEQMELRSKSLEEQLKMKEKEILLKLAETWDGGLPEVISGDALNIILDKISEDK